MKSVQTFAAGVAILGLSVFASAPLARALDPQQAELATKCSPKFMEFRSKVNAYTQLVKSNPDIPSFCSKIRDISAADKAAYASDLGECNQLADNKCHDL